MFALIVSPLLQYYFAPLFTYPDYCMALGLPSGWYLTSLAGILRLI